MDIHVLAFRKSVRPTVLASVEIEISFPSGDSIVIADARVLRNRQGSTWLSMPNYSEPSSDTRGGARYQYFPAVVLSAQLKRAVDDVVLPAFEEWEAEGGAR
jgi:hypothetical protein